MEIGREFQVEKTAYTKSLTEEGGGPWQGCSCSWETEKGGGDMRQGWRHMPDMENVKDRGPHSKTNGKPLKSFQLVEEVMKRDCCSKTS